jgi:hypothetical protein
MPSVNYLTAVSLATCLTANTAQAVMLNDQLEITGTIEIEATYDAAANQPNTTDLTVATGELGIHGHLNDWTSGSLIILFEDGGNADDTFEVDEAAIHFANPAVSPYHISIGRLYVPFGNYNTAFVQDPLTLEVGETRATTIELGWEQDNLQASAYLLNGNQDNADDRIGHYGLRLGAQHAWEDTTLHVGLSYTNSIAESGGLSETTTADDKVAGFSIDVQAQTGATTFSGEYVAAQDDLVGADSQAKAYHLEISYEIGDKTIGLTWQGTSKASAFDLPEQRIGAMISTNLLDDVGLTLEVGNAKSYASDNSRYAIAQLAVTF